MDLSDIPSDLRQIQTPLRAQELEWSLRAQLDREFCDYLPMGMMEGVRVGFCYSSCSCVQAKSNMRSALVNPGVVEEYLKKDVGLGCVVGPISPNTLPRTHVSRLGVIPESHHSDEWRLIVDLSHPSGASVNDGIKPELCTLRYTSVDRQ